MDCALWLNKRKVFSAEEIPANFDIAAIRGYFLGGSLIPWLKSHGGEGYAVALEKVNPQADGLNDTLAVIFGQRCNAPVHQANEQLISFIDTMKGGCAPENISEMGSVRDMYAFGSAAGLGSFGANIGSYRWGAFSFGSFSSGSYSFGSYKGFSLWEWEWEWYLSSFRKGRYGGSFSGGSYNFAGVGFGSYNFGSFGYGSYTFKGFAIGSPRFGEAALGSYNGVPLSSMCWISADEYDEIMYRSLGLCPLNRFGYGIHII